MDATDFDRWREAYDRSSYRDQVEFYARVAAAYPDQRVFSAEAARRFVAEAKPRRVLELGGWKGELAETILSDALRDPPINEWLNIEIAPQVIEERVCFDPRYQVEIPDDFFWRLDRDWSRFDTFIASHVLEHLKAVEVGWVLGKIQHVKHLYVDAPLPELASMWAGGLSSHILEIGWGELDAMIRGHGFLQVGHAPGLDGQIRWYRNVA